MMINIKSYAENRRILQIAIPSIISNITVPLLGLIDVTIVGHLGSPAYIGAIAVGGMLFNIIYWIFGFLRMGTSGMTSQAYGQHDLNEITRLLLRSVGVGLSIAICLLILQYPILKLAFTFIQTTPEVEQLATTYFYICIWGAPAMLGLYGFAGWFIGMQNSRFPMYIAITQNIVNITASLCLVYLLDMKVAGVATGTLIAQYAGVIMAIFVITAKSANELPGGRYGRNKLCTASFRSTGIYSSVHFAWLSSLCFSLQPEPHKARSY